MNIPLGPALPAERPWQDLDPALARLLLPELPRIADEIATAVAIAIPEYSLPMRGSFGQAVRPVIEAALAQFVEQMGRQAPTERPGRDVYIDLGRGELRAGRGLDALTSAYRLGARVAWRGISSVALKAEIDAEMLSLLAESIFAYIDELSAESVEGYAREQAAAAGERERHRSALMRLLVTPGLDLEDAEHQAAVAAVALPRMVAVLAADYRDAQRLAGRIGGGTIGARIDEHACVLVGDPDHPACHERLVQALGSSDAALGPTVPWQQAARSHQRAVRCARLQAAGVLAPGLVFASEHLGEMAAFADPDAVEELAGTRLAPLAELTPAARARLELTLLEWLCAQGSVPATALALGVHRQTVRYRLARLTELFGDALENPDFRFELELALRGRRYVADAEGVAQSE